MSCRWLFLVRVALAFILLASVAPARADDESLGEKIKDFFQATPTPTPHRHHRRVKKKRTPTPTPSPTPKKNPSSKKKKKKASPTPTPEESPSPGASPSPSATPSPEKSPNKSPNESPNESASTSPGATVSPAEKKSITASVLPNEIRNYDKNPPKIRKILDTSLALTNEDLKYTYGSADPANGGMDCSGFIYYVLRENGIKDVPRDASGQYSWVRKAGKFRAVLSRDLGSFELDELKPGDLLFWTGTYDVEKDPPVTHTMIYLGIDKDSGKPLMLGASDGRTFEGKRMSGVSVFDFKTVSKKETSSGRHPRFVGYGHIPGL